MIQLIKELEAHDIDVTLNGDNLNLNFNSEVIDPSVLNKVRNNKKRLVQFLKKHTNRVNNEAIETIPEAESYPLSSGQFQLWMHSQFEEGSIAYNIQKLVKLNGQYDISCFQKAIHAVVKRHEILRTAFKVNDEGTVRQYVLKQDECAFGIVYHDFRNEPDPEDAAKSFIEKDAFTLFDLSKAPLLRANLLQIKEDQYVFCFNIHHIISDGKSMELLTAEVMEYYDAFFTGRTPNLTPLNIQYKDYTVWQLSALEDNAYGSHKEYWSKHLSGEIPVLDLPSEKKRPKVKTYKGSGFKCKIGKETTAELRNFAAENEGSVFLGFLTVLNVLLYRYTGEQDIVIGNPVEGRNHIDLENQIGYYVNTIALRNQIDPDLSFTDLYHQIKETSLESLAYQNYPLAKILEDINVQRDVSRSPLFDILINYLRSSNADSISNIGRNEIQDLGAMNISFDIELVIEEKSNEIELSACFNRDVYTRETIEQFIMHFKRLLKKFLVNPTSNIATIDFLSSKEKKYLLNELNTTDALPLHEMTMLDQFKKQVQLHPEKIAVVHEGEQLTYQELDEKSSLLSDYLLSRNLERKNFICVFMEKRLEMLVGILGILKSGMAYVPIDPLYPKKRMEFIVEDTDAQLILSTSDWAETLSGYSEEFVLYLDEKLPSKAEFSNEETKKVSEEDLAYIVYTSGSSGKPKGVKIGHRALFNLLRSIQEKLNFDTELRLLNLNTFTFDISVLDFFTPLISGGTLILVGDKASKNPELIKEIIKETKPNCIQTTPSRMQLLLHSDWEGDKEIDLLCGGEAMSEELKTQLLTKGKSLWNMYGPTETTIYSTGLKMEKDKPVSIGRPLANTDIYILDKQLNVLPFNATGELCIGGAGIAEGYLNRAALMAEKFVDHPFKKGERLYRSGDLACWGKDGNLYFKGRLDNQLKLRGYRIELGEIETVLNKFPAIQQSVVVGRSNKREEQQLVAYYSSEDSLDRSLIQVYLKEELPDYMIPSTYIHVKEFPLTKNGKIDYKGLPDPDLSKRLNRVFKVSKNETERVLVKIWEDILDVGTISIEDDFFELGGHSLLAVRLTSSIRKHLNKAIPITDVFQYANIAALAEYLDQQEINQDAVIIERAERTENIPLSFAQERLWFIHELQGSTHYHIPTVLRLKGDLDIDRLEYAINEVVNRHEILRTVYLKKDGIAYQKVLPKDQWRLSRELTQAGVGEQLNELIAQEVNKSYEIAADHMLRARLIQLSKEEFVLVLVIHHIASDAWSISIIINELLSLYESATNQTSTALANLPIQYIDYAVWQRKRFYEQGFLEKKLKYWETKLADVEAVELPFDFKYPPLLKNKGQHVDFKLSSHTLEQVKKICEAQGVTLFMFLLGVVKILLHKYSGQTDICIGTANANRTHKDVEPLVGFFVNMIALRNDLSGNPAFKDLLETVKKSTLEAFTMLEVPFEKVVDRVVRNRTSNRSPLFQVMLQVNNAPIAVSHPLEGLTITGASSNYEIEKYEMTIWATEKSNGLDMSISYNVELFESATIEKLKDHFLSLLNEITKDTSKPIGAFNILSEEEQQFQIETLNQTKVSYPKGITVLDQFKAQVQASPEKIAVLHEGASLTYQELDEQSSLLSTYLLSSNLEPQSLICLFMEKRLEMLIGILGVLKSGMTYVPIDPLYPKERVDFILKDTNVQLLLSTSNWAETLSDYSGSFVLYLDEKHSWKTELTNEELRQVSEKDLAYIIYTSGSSGKPKGVKIAHRALFNLLWSIQEKLKFDADLRLLNLNTFTFDISVLDFFAPLISGGTLILVGEEASKDPESIKAIIKETKPNCIQSTPSRIQLLLHSDWKGDKEIDLLCGGEAMSEELKTQLLAKGKSLWNLYGPTETTIYSSGSKMEKDKPVSIGRPLANTDIYILDKQLNIVPFNSTGELCIGGAGIAEGYLNRETLTAEKFIKHPFKKGERLYRTGDLACWGKDGNLYFKGRLDNQLKLRGYRIELGEIETVLNKFPAIQQSVVLVRSTKSEAQQLVAYYRSENSLDHSLIQEHLKKELPAYMIPNAYVHLNEFPLTHNGKVDQKRLPDPDFSRLNKRVFKAPKNETERVLVKIWEELLSMEQISIEDNFFELGGNSLLAVRIVSSIRKYLDKVVSVTDVFKYANIVSLAKFLDRPIYDL